MKNRKLTSALIGLTGVLCVLSVAFFVFRDSGPAIPDDGTNAKKTANARNGASKKWKTRSRPNKAERVDGQDAGEDDGSEKKKPSFTLDDDDEARLNAEQRRTIMAIREALDNNDRKTVVRLVQKLQKSEEWPDGIPKSIKMAAIEALGWFGSSCLPELAGFLGDADEEVAKSAIDRYQEMLADFELSDFERSSILVQAAMVIDDPEAMDAMLFELNNMRHSVAVKTMKQLMAKGNEATKSILLSNVAFYTGEEGLDTPAKLDEWLERNPDEEGDAEFYGGSNEKSSADEASNRR